MELRKALQANNVDDSEFTDYQLENFFRDTLRDLEGRIGFKTEPQVFEDVVFDFNSKQHICNHSNISNLELGINNTPLNKDSYRVNKRTGIIKFNRTYNGDLNIKYNYGIPESTVQNEIYPLVYDIIAQLIVNGVNNNIKSITEDNFSITYTDNLQGLSKSVDERINRLRVRYNSRMSLI